MRTTAFLGPGLPLLVTGGAKVDPASLALPALRIGPGSFEARWSF